MIIDEKIIKDIFNLKLKLRNDDKNKLSKYQEIIPMYDIYSHTIYPINKKNIHYRLIDSHYRFINNEIKKWIQNLYKKYKSDKELANKLKYNLLIIDNYNIDILIETSYKTLYEFSPKLGLLVSICKRKSFNPFIHHLKPYYTKLELIKLGQNMKLIKNIELEKLLNQDIHYKLCKNISSNDVSFEEIKNHTLYIINSDIISYITFYSFYGSFLYNKYLRMNNYINNFLYDGIIKIINVIKKSPSLSNDYFVYRFIWDDSFISNLKIGQITIDNGFLSTTRDPFYSPGLSGKFGLTLIKINIPKNIKGLGIFIENLSLFQKEEEFLLPPFTKLKLLSKDNNFKYYHTNEEFEKLIEKKYEFEYIENDFSLINNYKIKNNIKKIIDFKKYNLHGNDRISLFKNFISESNQILININNNDYLLNCMFFDSTETSSYSKLYYNKIKDGLLISIYDNGYPYLNIECGKDMVINYINKFYNYNKTKIEINDILLDIILEIGRIFHYKQTIIFPTYRNFSEFKYDDEKQIFLYTHFYNHTIYEYAKNKNKFINDSFLKNNIGWFKTDNILNSKLDVKIKEKLNLKQDTIRDALIFIIENNFIIYDKFIDLINIEKNYYFIYEIYEKLNNQNRLDNFIPNIFYDDEDTFGDEYKLIFRQPIRRY
jgi:hypothetical protein